MLDVTRFRDAVEARDLEGMRAALKDRPKPHPQSPAAYMAPTEWLPQARGAGMTHVRIYPGDNRVSLRGLPDNHFHSMVTDPPYGLSRHPDMREVLRHWLAGDDYAAAGGGFMGKSWDSFAPGPATWAECLRVLRPGAWCVVFAGSRTQDLMALSLRLAGFEVMDTGQWIYGSGFPKSMDLGKATGREQWDGYGTALKPAYEPFILCRKPLDGTYAHNAVTHGVGGLNIDGCRVATEDKLGGGMVSKGRPKVSEGWDSPWMHDPDVTERKKVEAAAKVAKAEALGRWPANVVTSDLPESWARYFYCAKASQADRNEGCDGLPEVPPGDRVDRVEGSDGMKSPRAGAGRTSGGRNIHPTVKPVDLMRWLVRLVTPSGGLTLDPFAGSGSTGKAATLEGFDAVLCELEDRSVATSIARCKHAGAAVTIGVPGTDGEVPA